MRESSEGQSPARRRRKRVRARRSETTASTRIAILKNAATAFRRVGYHGASVEEIAAALDMKKKGNLYYYFRNKEEILFACHQYSLDQLLGMLEDVEARDMVPEEKLRRVIVGAVHLILDELHGTALFLDLEALTPAHLKAVITRRDRFDQGIRRILHECLGNGRFDPAGAKLMSFALLGAINWIPRWYNPDGPATSQEIADRFANYLLAGLQLTKATL